MKRALIVGGAGLVGRATARRLLASGWRVDVTGRDAPRLPDGDRLRAALGDGAELLEGLHRLHRGGRAPAPAAPRSRRIAAEIDWLVAGGYEPDPEFFARFFDYVAEDRFLAGARR